MNKKPRILYAIQGTGNGHVARAREIIPILQKLGSLDVALSGDQSEVSLPVAPKYRSVGLTFIYNSRGGVSYWRTIFKNNPFKIYKEIKRFPIEEYDLVINDFEFITAWACRLKGLDCYGLGHQASFSSTKVPRPKQRSFLGEIILKYYAPVTHAVGFHFKNFDKYVFEPVIRKEIRNLTPQNEGHYTVYLPAFGDEKIASVLNALPEVKWEVFSKKARVIEVKQNVKLIPVNNELFVKSLATSTGVLTSAGFESPAEALFLGKKVAVIPIKHQYEQFCNAAAMKQMGIPVFNDLSEQMLPELKKWIAEGNQTRVDYPDRTEEIIEMEIMQVALGSWAAQE